MNLAELIGSFLIVFWFWRFIKFVKRPIRPNVIYLLWIFGILCLVSNFY